MSQIGGDPLGRARIDITANTAPLKQGLEEAKGQAAKGAEQIEEAVGGGKGGGLKGLGQLRSGLARLVWPTAIAAGVVSFINRIIEARNEVDNLRGALGRSAAEFSRGLLRSTTDNGGLAGKLKAIDEQTRAAQQQAEDERLKRVNEIESRSVVSKGYHAAIGAATVEQINKQHEDAERVRLTAAMNARNRVIRQAAEDERNARAKALDAIQRRTEEAATAGLDGEQKVAAVALSNLRTIEEEKKNATEAEKAALDRLAAIISANAVKQIEQIKDRAAKDAADERLRQEEDRLRLIEQQNSALRQQATIYNNIRGQAAQQFGADSIATRQLTEIRNLLDTIASQRRNVYPTDGGPFG